jgi:uncharacterized OsmC-like protein
MAEELRIQTSLLNGRMQYRSTVRHHPAITSDYGAPLGDDQGPTSLELFLVSLSTCAGSAIAHVLRRMHKTVASLSIEACGLRKSEHPMGFQSITLGLELVSDDTSPEELEKAVGLAEGICPVWSMIKGNVQVTVESRITALSAPTGV